MGVNASTFEETCRTLHIKAAFRNNELRQCQGAKVISNILIITINIMLLLNSTVVICAVVIYSIYCCLKIFFNKLNLPGPKKLPLIGNIHILFGKELLDFMVKMSDVYSSPFQMSWFNKLFIVIYESDDAKIILRSENCRDKGIFYKFMTPLFGEGLLTAPGHTWGKMRSSIAPTFSMQMLKNLFNIFIEEAAIFTHELKENYLKKNEISLLEYTSNSTWKMACGSTMGIKLEPNENKEYVKAIYRIKNSISYRIKTILFFFDAVFFRTHFGRKIKKCINLIHFLADKMIQRRMCEINNPANNKNNHGTFFDIWIKAFNEKGFMDKDTHDNIMTMLLAASDTITVATNFIIFMLANFPEIQEKVYEELFKIYGAKTIKSAPIKYEDLQYMNYLDRVIKETMRIFPPVPFIIRQVTKDIKIGEVTFPKDANIVINILKMHRNEKYWPDPLTFDPDRFLLERNCQSHHYMPFSYGPRNCIGIKYAMICLKVITATLLRTFVFKVNKSIKINEIKLKFDITLSTERSLKVKIEER